MTVAAKAQELEVWLFAHRAGTLTLVDGRLDFCYAPGWLSQPDAVILSASPPLQAALFDDPKTRPFFAGLLPERDTHRDIRGHPLPAPLRPAAGCSCTDYTQATATGRAGGCRARFVKNE